MDSLVTAHATLEKRSNLARTLQDVQKTIDLLQNARDSVADYPEGVGLAMAKLNKPIKASFEKLDDDLKEVNKGLNAYQKALDKKFKKNALPTASTEPIAGHEALVNRAIVMHLLREGRFGVAEKLVGEMNGKARTMEDSAMHGTSDTPDNPQTALGLPDIQGEEHGWLQQRFAEMYHILDSLRTSHDLTPAIAWARQHSRELDLRGSNLEFELCRLKFLELYTATSPSSDPWEGPTRALEYARQTFPALGERYARETSRLLGSLAFAPNLAASPYAALFHNPTIWAQTATSFTTEFTSLLGLSSTPPLYTSVTAGCIALPVLEKVERIMAQTRGQWTSVNELPVETPLPAGFQFHQLFVCPVSKEQGTDANPPMLLMCGHVIAKESLEAVSRGKARVKCPYCPGESGTRDARRIFI